MRLSWRAPPPPATDAIAEADSVTFELRAEVGAWLSFAISTDGSMTSGGRGSPAIFAEFDEARSGRRLDGGVTSVRLLTSKADQTPSLLSGEAVTVHEVSQEDGVTSLVFSIPLVADCYSEEGPVRLVACSEGPTTVMISHGKSNRLGTHPGDGYVSASLDLRTGDTEDVTADGSDLWAVHGALMGLAWLVLAPAGVMAARYGKGPLGAPRWLQIHRGAQLLAVLLTAAGAAVGAAAAADEGLPHFDSAHGKLGLAVGVLLLLQAMGGVFRAKKPAAGEAKSSVRAAWELSHRLGGHALLWVAVATCVLGAVKLDDREDTDAAVIVSYIFVALNLAAWPSLELLTRAKRLAGKPAEVYVKESPQPKQGSLKSLFTSSRKSGDEETRSSRVGLPVPVPPPPVDTPPRSPGLKVEVV